MKTSFIAASLMFLVFGFWASPAAAQHETEANDPTVVQEPDVVLHVKGLSCAKCARSLTKQLQKPDAVDQVQVLLEDDQRALITFKKDQAVSEETLSKSVEAAGFSTRAVGFAETTDESRDDG